MGKFYAIKVGKGVKDKIVESWEECQKYVIGFPSIYHSFKQRHLAERYLEKMQDWEVTRKLEISSIYRIKRLKQRLQEKCSFVVPDYILQEIICNDSTYDGIQELIDFAKSIQHLSAQDEKILVRDLKNGYLKEYLSKVVDNT